MYAKFLKTNRAAELLGVSPWTLAKWRRQGRGPDFLRMGHNVRYTAEALEAYAARSIVQAGA